MKLSLFFALYVAVAGAFAPPSSKIYNRDNVVNQMSSEPLADIQGKVRDLVSQINVDGLTENLDQIRSNMMDGEVGSRGEAYAIAQFAVLLCILGGGIPFVGDALMFLLGPGLLIVGAAVAFISLNDLGESLSPWPVPPAQGSLKTSGLYAEMRHPTYAGLLAFCAGLSIVSGSATRLLLTAVLLYSLDVKSDYEEKELLKKYPEYANYKNNVTSKFFPASIAKELPWMKSDSPNELPWKN